MDILKKEVDLINSVNFFMKNYAHFASSISFSRRFVFLDYSIKDTGFTVKVNYDKEEFGHLIYQFVSDMIKGIKENKKLTDVGWNNTTVFVDEQEVSENFEYCVFSTVQTY